MMDPGLMEEAARAGALTVVANVHKELCAVHKADGIGLSLPQVWGPARLRPEADLYLQQTYHPPLLILLSTCMTCSQQHSTMLFTSYCLSTGISQAPQRRLGALIVSDMHGYRIGDDQPQSALAGDAVRANSDGARGGADGPAARRA